jgi:hypothetical protein
MFPGLIVICIWLGTREAIHEEEQRKKGPWYWMRRR